MTDLSRSRVLVVAALVVEGGRILITQRTDGQKWPNKWEFPGGKVEPGEDPVAALRRELLEEVGLEGVSVGPIWDALFHPYPSFDLLMLVYPCRAFGQTPRCLEVADSAWVTPGQMDSYDILPADGPLVKRLHREGVPHW